MFYIQNTSPCVKRTGANLTVVPACWLIWMGAHSLAAGDTVRVAGEAGQTSRVNALLSTTKAAVGSGGEDDAAGGSDDDDDDDDVRITQRTTSCSVVL